MDAAWPARFVGVLVNQDPGEGLKRGALQLQERSDKIALLSYRSTPKVTG